MFGLSILIVFMSDCAGQGENYTNSSRSVFNALEVGIPQSVDGAGGAPCSKS